MSDESNERYLWSAVMEQAIADANPKMTDILIEKLADPEVNYFDREKEKARAWFGGRDFKTVCSLAGFNPDWVMRKVQPGIERYDAQLESRVAIRADEIAAEREAA